MSSYLVAGAGLFGATCARLLADAGHKVRVVERRAHIGGNCYDEVVDGILCGAHGGHIFHTNAARVWDFVNRFAEWRYYEHRVRALAGGRVYSLPPNLATLDALGLQPGAEAERRIVELFYDGYSLKQWGRPFAELPASVQRRVPVRRTYDDRYFTDRWQGLPVGGYTELVRAMLHGIPVELEAPFMLTEALIPPKGIERVIFSGPIDALFDYRLGRLAYRSLRFVSETLERDDYQGCPTMNYCDASVPWTRILEWKHFGWQRGPQGRTRVTMEYPAADGEPYYPVDDERNRALYREYAGMAQELPWLRVGGRLGSYQYLNMDQCIAQAMQLVQEECE